MPVTGQKYRVSRCGESADVAVKRFDHLFTARDGQGAARQEVELDIGDDQRIGASETNFHGKAS